MSEQENFHPENGARSSEQDSNDALVELSLAHHIVRKTIENNAKNLSNLVIGNLLENRKRYDPIFTRVLTEYAGDVARLVLMDKESLPRPVIGQPEWKAQFAKKSIRAS